MIVWTTIVDDHLLFVMKLSQTRSLFKMLSRTESESQIISCIVLFVSTVIIVLDVLDSKTRASVFLISSMIKRIIMSKLQRSLDTCKKPENGENFSQVLFLSSVTTKLWQMIISHSQKMKHLQSDSNGQILKTLFPK